MDTANQVHTGRVKGDHLQVTTSCTTETSVTEVSITVIVVFNIFLFGATCFQSETGDKAHCICWL